jgi:hypothetical protein
MTTENPAPPLQFSDSFQLVNKNGDQHMFTVSGTLEQKKEILTTSAQFIKEAKAKGWTNPAAGIPPGPALSNDPNTTTEIITAEQLIVSADENGSHFKIKGGRYKKHGVAIYEEYLPVLGIDPNLRPGAHEFTKKVVVQKTINGDKSSSKVVALA